MAKPKPTRLRYTGPEPNGLVPLPEGWPAADHNEPNDAARAEKLASGLYESITITPAPAAEE